MKQFSILTIITIATLLAPNLSFASAPVVDISANPDSINSGKSTKISWFSLDSDSCIVKKDGYAWKTGTYGMEIDSGILTDDTSFTLNCTGNGGTNTSVVTVQISNKNVQSSDSTQSSTDLSPVQAVDLPIAISSFDRDLMLGMSGRDVQALQKFLNSNGYIIAKTGAGSVGNEDEYFGQKTQDAIIRLQKANNIIPPAGFFGPITRAYVNRIFSK